MKERERSASHDDRIRDQVVAGGLQLGQSENRSEVGLRCDIGMVKGQHRAKKPGGSGSNDSKRTTGATGRRNAAIVNKGKGGESDRKAILSDQVISCDSDGHPCL